MKRVVILVATLLLITTQTYANDRVIGVVGLSIIKYFEGFRETPYVCPSGTKTIGYGFTSANFVTMDKRTADIYILGEVIKVSDVVNAFVEVPLTQAQFDAIVSFTYNCGSGNFSKSTLLAEINKGNIDCVPYELNRWVYGGGRFLKGLETRRVVEGNLFSGGQVVVPKL